MAIKTQNEQGFVVSVKLPDGSRWEQEIQYEALSAGLTAWAVRNGFSQAFTDTIAGCKDTATARSKLEAKATAFSRNEVPTERGAGSRSFESKVAEEAFKITVEILRNLGLKKAEAEDLVDSGKALSLLETKTQLTAEQIQSQILAKAQRRVDDCSLIPAA